MRCSKITCDSVKLTRIAEVIGQRNQYVVQYRFEADKYFYDALAKEFGNLNPEEIFELRQILESPLYNIGSRLVGWTVSLGLTSTIYDIASDIVVVEDIPIVQEAGYATLLNSKRQYLSKNRLTSLKQ